MRVSVSLSGFFIFVVLFIFHRHDSEIFSSDKFRYLFLLLPIHPIA